MHIVIADAVPRCLRTLTVLLTASLCSGATSGAHARAELGSDTRRVFEKGVGSCGADLLPADPPGLLASSSATLQNTRLDGHGRHIALLVSEEVESQ